MTQVLRSGIFKLSLKVRHTRAHTQTHAHAHTVLPTSDPCEKSVAGKGRWRSDEEGRHYFYLKHVSPERRERNFLTEFLSLLAKNTLWVKASGDGRRRAVSSLPLLHELLPRKPAQVDSDLAVALFEMTQAPYNSGVRLSAEAAVGTDRMSVSPVRVQGGYCRLSLPNEQPRNLSAVRWWPSPPGQPGVCGASPSSWKALLTPWVPLPSVPSAAERGTGPRAHGGPRLEEAETTRRCSR